MEGKTKEETNRMLKAVFRNFQARREALIKALTTDHEEFFKQCDPEMEDGLCLFGLPDGKWEVKPPADFVPPPMPEPKVGINFLRAEMAVDKWVYDVAVASDAWLISVAFFLGAKCAHFNKDDRARLFAMINALPTLRETVTRHANEKAKTVSKISAKSSSSGGGSSSKAKGKQRAASLDEAETDGVCGACRTFDAHDDWIACDTCDKWYHVECVGVSIEASFLMDEYECPPCMRKARRPGIR